MSKYSNHLRVTFKKQAAIVQKAWMFVIIWHLLQFLHIKTYLLLTQLVSGAKLNLHKRIPY
ncbi:hypothetical protein NQ314_021001 [Rhamnusium bicolor]|uniref:Uncharacterized protein n=1 Tax=Rhamnusium bicolor TaxID=1586634 RepID=A0AAV8WKK9_9CUCU|nr:hypothetical protein NQ314_021001 [Rhamnusium bicolor]